jgi:hypothetical protein
VKEKTKLKKKTVTMSVDEYVLVKNVGNIRAAYKVEERKEGRIFLTKRVKERKGGKREFVPRYNAHGNIVFPSAEARENGIPESQATVFREKPTYLGEPGMIEASDTLVEQVINEVVSDEDKEKHVYHPGQEQNDQLQKAYEFLRKAFYCFRDE